MRNFALLAAAATAGLILSAGPAAAQATRTWVSGVGDDANPCSRTAPCKTFAGAISKTAAGGEISVLDPGGFGGVTITKSLTINGMWGGEASALVSGTNAIIINALATDTVVLRGITVEGLGAGLTGIKLISPSTLHIEHCMVEDFRATSAGNGNGIAVTNSTGLAKLIVTDTVLQNNGALASLGGGVVIRPTGSGSVEATLTRTSAINGFTGITVDGDNSTGPIDVTIREGDMSGNTTEGLVSRSPNNSDSLVNVMITDSTVGSNAGIGVRSVGQRSTVRIGGSTVSGNGAAGLQANNSGILQSYGDNYTDGNGAANVGVTPATPS